MPRFAANLSMLFTELPFLERFEAAANAGFRGVEYLFPYSWSPQALQAALTAHGLTQVLFNLPPGDWDAGERGIACLPDRVDEFKAGVAKALEYADVLGCMQMNCLAGLQPAQVSDAQAWETLVSNLQYAADAFAAEGKTLLVEAINSRVDMRGFFLDTSEKTLAAIAAANRPNIRFQYDIYHMQIMEGDIARSLQAQLPHIGHIQFADNPGRHEPGSGEICFDFLFSQLDAMGYEGWVSAEYRPSGTTDDSLAWFAPFR